MMPTAEHVRQATALVHAALAYRDCEPWTVIAERECFALRDPVSHEQIFVSVRGHAGGWAGLALFRGSEGIQSMSMLMYAPLESLDEREVLDISGTFVELRPMCLLPERANAPLEAAGVRIPSNELAPDFMTYLPGYVPGGPTVEEIRLLTLALQQAAAVTLDVVDDIVRLGPTDRNWIERRLVRGETTRWEYVAVGQDVVPSPHRLSGDPVDELTRARLSRLPRHFHEIWAIDLVPISMVLELSDRERWPIVVALLIVDRESGRTVHSELLPAPARYDGIGGVLARSFVTVGARPGQLRVRDYRLRARIAPVARALECKLISMRYLPALDEAHVALRAALNPPRGPAAG
jgi:hypothetical protein